MVVKVMLARAAMVATAGREATAVPVDMVPVVAWVPGHMVLL